MVLHSQYLWLCHYPFLLRLSHWLSLSFCHSYYFHGLVHSQFTFVFITNIINITDRSICILLINFRCIFSNIKRKRIATCPRLFYLQYQLSYSVEFSLHPFHCDQWYKWFAGYSPDSHWWCRWFCNTPSALVVITLISRITYVFLNSPHPIYLNPIQIWQMLSIIFLHLQFAFLHCHHQI